jgi:uncharacterized repeat protein (TIGR01451 family)
VPNEPLDAILDPLADNGGPTQTHALVTGSPAVDAAGPGCPPPNTDQRGVSRPQGAACDIGSFELEQAPPTAVDLSVSKTDSPDPVTEGEELTYTVAVTNSGPNDATGVTLTDTLPDNVLFVSASAGCTEGGGTVTCNIGDLTSTNSAAVEIVVTPDQVGNIENTATVTGTERDPITANNTDTEQTTVAAPIPLADLSVNKVDAPDPVLAHDSLTYTVTVANDGPDDATGETLIDTLPAGVTFASATPSQGDPCTGNGTVNCNLGSIAPGGSATVTIRVNVNLTTTGTLSNTVQTVANEEDPNTLNNTDTEETTVEAVTCDGLSPTIIGTPDNDPINGTGGTDVIHGLSGNDTISGGNADDVICGGNDNDTVNGGNGSDRLFGEASDDTLNGNNGDDALDGGDATDTCNGGNGSDTATDCEAVTSVP